MQQIGLFGGSFNPVHLGHLLVAQAALEEVPLDRVVFIPAAQSPFKPGVPLAAPEIRLRLLRLALAGEPRFILDDQEIRRGGISYTIDTVRAYQTAFPSAVICCLIGADHTAQLPLWRDAEQLAKSVEFIVIPRPGQPVLPCPAPFRCRALSGFPLGVSASQIRERVQQRKPIEGLVPAAVAETIRNYQLYL